MHAFHKLTPSEREQTLRAAIRRRFPDITPDNLNDICEKLNTRRPYCIKYTADPQKFLNLATREQIVHDGVCAIAEVLPLYGEFRSPYFEKKGAARHSIPGHINDTQPAAAVKIRVGRDNARCSSTHTLILFS